MRCQQQQADQGETDAPLQGRQLCIAIRQQNEPQPDRCRDQKGEKPPFIGKAEERQQEQPIHSGIRTEMATQQDAKPDESCVSQ